MSSLFARLSLFFFLLLLTLGLATLWVSHRNSQNYFLEFTQELNEPLAMYMADTANLIQNNEPSPEALAKLAEHVMVINPSVEVYLLDADGVVIAPSTVGQTGIDNNDRFQVDLKPIQEYLSADAKFPILGSNPKKSGVLSIFSVAPLMSEPSIGSNSMQLGFVYVVLSGERHQSLLRALSSSYSLKNLFLTLSGAMLMALITGIAVFFLLTRRLGLLTRKANQWRESLNLPSIHSSAVAEDNTSQKQLFFKRSDEIDDLAATYDSMASQLVTQYQDLQQKDSERREFFANISHDLRTPLTTMQSYLETLAVRSDALSDELKQKYVETAHKQSIKLRRLVMQLFDLSKLSSGNVVPNKETFSMLELTYDCFQQFSLEAESARVTLKVSPVSDENHELLVLADIALIQRVFENLLANALRHTPEEGAIHIELSWDGLDRVDVVVSDTGAGIPADIIQHVFKRHFSSMETASRSHDSAGLGLSIVKSIIELHDSTISVVSDADSGTQVKFSLPSA